MSLPLGLLSVLTFLQTDLLPLVSVGANGDNAVTFFIDAGVTEVALNTDFAREFGVYPELRGIRRPPCQTARSGFSEQMIQPAFWTWNRGKT